MSTPRRQLGEIGERHARSILEGQGMGWIESNWRCAAGEVDLVMRQGEAVVFVEVKVRRGESRGSAEEAITPAKATKLLETAAWYIADHFPGDEPEWRIDLIAITLDSVGKVIRRTHIESAVETG
jgi:putative endonuclease